MLFCVVFPGNSEVTLLIAPYFENTWPEVSYKSAISLTFSVKGDTQIVHPLVFDYSTFFSVKNVIAKCEHLKSRCVTCFSIIKDLYT